MALNSTDDAAAPSTKVVKRHRLSTRIWHWVNVVAVFTLLGSGMTIFNAHPRLYWGSYGANFDAPWLEINERRYTDGRVEGFLMLGGAEVDTTGFLGVFEKDGETRTRAFPHYLTIPADYSLAEGRRYHFLAAWVFGLGVFVYILWSLLGRHARELVPSRRELRPGHVWDDLKRHAKFDFAHREGEPKYNLLQKISYFAVIFVFLPGLVLSGLGMSPNMNAAWPWILDLFGGRQSARSMHFIFGFLLAGFIFVHLALVLLTGPINQIRSMITGRFGILAGDRT